MAAVLPIAAIVLIISITAAPLSAGTLVLFLFGAAMVILGMSLFTMGADMAMTPMGEGIGVQINHARRIYAPLLVCFVLGVLITLAEPDLQVLAEQVPGVPNWVITVTVAAGVGLFLLLAELRMLLNIPLSYMLVFFYIAAFFLAQLAPENFVPAAFDSGGVTTGPMTVPFVMAMGVGLASVRRDKSSRSDNFGLISLCSVGPVLAMLLLGVLYRPEHMDYVPKALAEIETTSQAAAEFAAALPAYGREMGGSLAPIVALFFVYNLIYRRFHGRQLLKIVTGFAYTYIGLVLFLVGVNVGFMPAGQLIGASLAQGGSAWLLVPLGMLIGYFIVKAEPAVSVLTHQVEDITNGGVSRRSIQRSLSIGIALSVGIAMLRILTGVSLMWFLIPGYVIALAMTFFVPQIFTGIAFDSGGVASGPMTTTFLLPLAMGACEALGGNVMADAFGMVAMVAMMPLVTIQTLGLVSKIREARERRRWQRPMEQMEDCIVYFDDGSVTYAGK